MSDYHTLIARAVEGLEKSSGKARRALYEQARTALVTQLCAIEPSLSESEITKERLALEDAIRKVEADVARKFRAELLEQQPWRDPARVEPRRIEPISRKPGPATAAEVEAPRPGQRPTARERLLAARSSTSTSREGVKDFRGVVGEVNALGSATAKAGQSARATRDSYGPVSSFDFCRCLGARFRRDRLGPSGLHTRRVAPRLLLAQLRARLARGIGLDLADRVFERQTFLGDLRFRERRLNGAQLCYKRRARPFIEGPPGLAAALV